jgi:hypothetical protein
VSDPAPTVEQLLLVVAEQARLIGELQARVVELERGVEAELEELLAAAVG